MDSWNRIVLVLDETLDCEILSASYTVLLFVNSIEECWLKCGLGLTSKGWDRLPIYAFEDDALSKSTQSASIQVNCHQKHPVPTSKLKKNTIHQTKTFNFKVKSLMTFISFMSKWPKSARPLLSFSAFTARDLRFSPKVRLPRNAPWIQSQFFLGGLPWLPSLSSEKWCLIPGGVWRLFFDQEQYLVVLHSASFPKVCSSLNISH